MIEVKDLIKRYGETTALDGVSFSVCKGGVHGILGALGSGKSTLTDIICGVIASSEGNVKVDGVDIEKDPKTAKRKIGYLPQKAPMYDDMTGYEYLVFVSEAKNVPYDKLYKNVKSALELTDLVEKSDVLIKNLLLSDRIRLGVAQAMLGNPEVIVLDEPFADIPQKDIDELSVLVKKLGGVKTVVIASSDLTVLEAICDDVVILSRGKVVAFDGLKELENRLAKNNTLKISVKGSESSVLSELSKIPSLLGCTVISSSFGALTLKLEYEQSADVREEVFEVFAKAGMPILSMDVEAMTLKDVFFKLCENEDGASSDTSKGKDTKRRRRTR